MEFQFVRHHTMPSHVE